MRYRAAIMSGAIVALVGSGCKESTPKDAPDDTATTDITPDDSGPDSGPDDTEDTGSPVVLPDVLESPEAVDPAGLSDCAGDAPVFDLRYAGVSPNVASMPMAVIDGVDGEVDGFCIEQTFEAGGVVTRCGRTGLDSPSAYLQGAPAPEQTVSLRLGVLQGDALCWADERHDVSLGAVPSPGFGYALQNDPLTTPDYPPSGLGIVNVEGSPALYAMALMDSPDFGISGGDILWYFAADDYASSSDTPIIESDHFDNGLLNFTVEDHDSTDIYNIFQRDFGGITTVNIDPAGFEWLRQDSCTESDDPTCVGFVHHGNAVMRADDVNVTMAYEQLYDASGEAYFYPNTRNGGYYLIAATFQGHAMSLHGELEQRFDLSFHDLFELDPDISSVHGARDYTSPTGENYRTAYYVNSSDVVQDAVDPELYHLTGTVTARPFNGFYHVALNSAGELSEHTLYSDLNTGLTWNTESGAMPLDNLGHNVEYMGADEDGAKHFMVYDRSVKKIATPLTGCAGFFHMIDDDGVMTVGGPYHNRAINKADGDICGNSLSYGNVNMLHDVNVEGYDAPVEVAVSFDNAGQLSERGGQWGTIAEVYAEGTPRLTGLYVNEDRFNPTGWTSSSLFLGYNIANNNPAGFQSLISDWPTLFVADAPFDLRGL